MHDRGGNVRRRTLRGIASVAGGGALLLGALALRPSTGDRAAFGVALEEMDVSRLSRAEIVARIQSWGRAHRAKTIACSVAGRPVTFEPETLGFSVDAEASASRALAIGRDASLARRCLQFFKRWLWPERVQAELRWDAMPLAVLQDQWERAIQDPPFSGGIAVSGARVSPLYPHAGTRLDRPAVTRQLLQAFRSGSPVGPLATRSETPKVPRAEVLRIVAQASEMLADDVRLATSDDAHRLQLAKEQVGSVLRVSPSATGTSLELSCAPDALHQLIAPQRAELERAPENAHFMIDAQDHVQVAPGHPGLVVDDQELAFALCAAAQSPEKRGILPLAPGAEPALSTQAALQAGVVGLVGAYTTRHACCQARVQNIHHIADLLDNTLVFPGDTFSVNQRVGPRTMKNGFVPAPSIEDGDMVDTVGGGVSQFATTLFNALFNGGYDILERQPHSYWFTRYPMGYDATLSYPHPDIVFKNDTQACALIKTQYTDTTITVKIYGNNGGRRVRGEVSARQNIVPPPVEFIPNPGLDADEEKTREGGMIGWTVTVKRTVTSADGKIKEERRKVTYKPRARRVEVHPCRIPAGEPGHTGERCPVPAREDRDVSASVADAGAK
jgi:vancomycin resistance protein YoaR